jgi:uncharacterized membrane protein
MMMEFHEMSGWWMLFGGMSMLLLWGTIVWLTGLTLKSAAMHVPVYHSDNMDDAERILRYRFASGELTFEQFQQALDNLRSL